MKRVMSVIAIALAAVLSGCSGNADEVNCAVCGQNFSNAQCQSFATAKGCTTGVAVTDSTCTMQPTTGCKFTGCPQFNGPVFCNANPPDAGP